MGRRNDHSRAEIREMALAAAERIIVAQGKEGLSARKIASGIGYTVGSLYLVFENLDDLLAQVNERTLEALAQALQAAVSDPNLPPRDCILALGRAYIEFATRHSHRWKLVFEHRMPPGQSVPDSFQDQVSRLFDLVRHQLERLAGQRARQDLALAASALWSGVHGICMLSLDAKLQVNADRSAQEVAESLIDNYLAGFVRGHS